MFFVGAILFVFPLASPLDIYNSVQIDSCDTLSVNNWSVNAGSLAVSIDDYVEGSGAIGVVDISGTWLMWLTCGSSPTGSFWTQCADRHVISYAFKVSSTAHNSPTFIYYWVDSANHYITTYVTGTYEPSQADTWQVFEVNLENIDNQGYYDQSVWVDVTSQPVEYNRIRGFRIVWLGGSEMFSGSWCIIDDVKCGTFSGDPLPTPTPTPAPTATPTPTPTPTGTASPTPTPSATPVSTPTPTPPPTPPPSTNSSLATLVISSTEGGTTVPSVGTYEYDLNTVVQLEARADEEYEFVSWVTSSGTVYSTSVLSLTLTESVAIQARFTALTQIPFENDYGDFYITLQGSGVLLMFGSVVLIWNDNRRKRR